MRELEGAPFGVLVSVDAIEHLCRPRKFVDGVYEFLNPGGLLVMSTHAMGYLRNLALAVTRKIDWHYRALWEGGHIKFWSRRTLTELCERSRFRFIDFAGAGRVPEMWKSTVLAFSKRL